MSSKMTSPAASGIPAGVPARLAAPDNHNPVKTRPVVDTREIADRFLNGVVEKLAEYDQATRKRRKFFDPQPTAPLFDLAALTEGIKEEVEIVFRKELATLPQPVDEAHQGELASLQAQAAETFLRSVHRLAVSAGDKALREQAVSLLPGLEAPDLTAEQREHLRLLQQRADEALEDVGAAFGPLLGALTSLREIVQAEAEVLKGTAQVGNRRIYNLYRAAVVSAARAIEAETAFKPGHTGARW